VGIVVKNNQKDIEEVLEILAGILHVPQEFIA